jgi:alpha-tubulin suppressor-like RCC1 family protein
MKTLWARLGLVLAVLTLLAAGAAPTEAASRRYTAIATGGEHACAITSSGKVYCWGSNQLGQLGNGDATHTRSTVSIAVAGNLRFKSIAASMNTTCAITSSGKAYCWGENTQGELGNGDAGVNNSDVPVAVVGGLRFSAISAGTLHFCGLTRNSRVYCWGENSFGQLGAGAVNVASSFTPVAASSSLRFKSITTSHYGTCGIASTSSVYCWGIGNGGSTPVKEVLESRLVRLESTETESCGLTRQGELLCLDNNDSYSKVVGAPRYMDLSVASGEVYSLCGIKRDGSVLCWGPGWGGADAASPTALNTTLKFRSVAQGGTFAGHDQFMCGLTRSGDAYCWVDGNSAFGNQNEGQLGDGTRNWSTDPVRVQ